MLPCPDEIYLQTCTLKKRAVDTVSPATSTETCFKKHAVLRVFLLPLFYKLLEVCLQGMVSKNEKHSATFRIVLLALSKPS